ncbi:hypothetical protein [Rhodobacter sp. CZR27]|uniref:hypothetical protein n=1 Tax=Rhodobacter sp. CZR27 TaxID=2033869 RepID=UPI000BBF2195|nr:hypothetical protein [Rhodobacter sp. CZR27]
MRLTGLLLAAFLLASPVASAAETGSGWLTDSTVLQRLPDDPEPAAEILIASPVRVLGPERAGRVEVMLSGWTDPEGRVLYASASPAVELARITAPDLLTRHLSPGPDGWTRAELRGWLDPAVLTEDPGALWQRAFTSYRSRCTSCHPRRAPGKYSVEEWKDYFRMMGPRTRLPQVEQLLIRAYLQRHASDAATLEGAPAPADDTTP